MSNHIHLLYYVHEPYEDEQIKHSLQSFTGKKILAKMSQNEKLKFKVDKADRKFQLWKRNPLSVEIISQKFLEQKINYIHDNPRRAELVKLNENYRDCSYRSYVQSESEFEFLTLW